MSSTSSKVGGRDVTRSTSNPTFLHTLPGHQAVRSASTGSFLTEDEKRRSVRYGNSAMVSDIKLLLIISLCFSRFVDAVHVILIPTVEEYRAAQFAELLWWDPESYQGFKTSG